MIKQRKEIRMLDFKIHRVNLCVCECACMCVDGGEGNHLALSEVSSTEGVGESLVRGIKEAGCPVLHWAFKSFFK